MVDDESCLIHNLCLSATNIGVPKDYYENVFK